MLDEIYHKEKVRSEGRKILKYGCFVRSGG